MLRHPDPSAAYPALTAYIADRSTDPRPAVWCERLHADEAEAVSGGLQSVAEDMERAQADYAEAAKAVGVSGYPYNAPMGCFLGLPPRDSGEPPVGYYMARQVMVHFRLGKAIRETAALINAGAPLRIVAARSKAENKPIRFVTFSGPEQIKIEGNSIVASNGKRRARLSPNWSVESCLVKVAEAMRTGRAYGESA